MVKLKQDAERRQLKRLSRQLLSVQEEERKMISRELHDVIGQTLTGINIRLANLKKEAVDYTRGLDRKIGRTQRLVQKSVDLVHQFARELRPAVLDDLGLIPALQSFLKQFAMRTGVRTRLKAFAGVEKLDAARRTAFYRVVQEAFANVERHAAARRAEVAIHKAGHGVKMRIADNGRAFDVQQTLRANRGKRLGLIGMRERLEMLGGKLWIESTTGKGTTIEAWIPFARKNGKSSGKPKHKAMNHETNHRPAG